MTTINKLNLFRKLKYKSFYRKQLLDDQKTHPNYCPVTDPSFSYSDNTTEVRIEIIHEIFVNTERHIVSTVVYLPELTHKEYVNTTKHINPDTIIDIILKRERILKRSVLNVNHFHGIQHFPIEISSNKILSKKE